MRKILILAALCIVALYGCRKAEAVSGGGAALSAASPDGSVNAAEKGTDARAAAEDTVERAADGKHLSEAEAFGKRLSKEKWTDDDFGFRYPSFMSKTETFMGDVPADVIEYKSGPVSICLWPMMGAWATEDDAFPVVGSVLSPQTSIASITYRARRKDIHSGYTTDGRVFYLKRRINVGYAVNHASVLVAIYPDDYRDYVGAIVREVQYW